MKINYTLLNIALVLSCLLSTGCSKFLDKKPDEKLAVPNTLEDLQALLDNWVVMNQREPSVGNIVTDEYYVTAQILQGASGTERNQFLWSNANQFTYTVNDWAQSYKIIYTANTVLENLQHIAQDKAGAQWKNINGQAYFFRANALLQAAFIWCLAYDSEESKTQLGLPLRLNTNFNEVSTRSTVAQTYEQIIKDLSLATSLLPDRPVHVYRPSKPAAYALLARTYLAMRAYEKAGKYADSALKLHDQLLDYNLLNSTVNYPFSTLQFSANPEIIFEARCQTPYLLAVNTAKVDPLIYNMYSNEDLRKVVFFRRYTDGSYGFKGTYSGGANTFFMGLATDELYLIKAECLARNGDLQESLKCLNTLLEKRWQRDVFQAFSLDNQEEILRLILTERQKELYRRGLRWIDIKRLNKEGNELILSRTIDGVSYTLPSNDLRYALPIPEDVIAMTGMQQNPR